VKKLEDWLHKQPEAAIVTSYTGGGAPRFFLAYNPELPNPGFAKLVISTPNAQAQERLLAKLRQSLAGGLVQEARVRVSRFVFGPYSPWPVAFRVSGPDLKIVRTIADQVLAKMRTDPHTRDKPTRTGESARRRCTLSWIRIACT
jgi:multidrug efflux pump subunit AcrB